MFRKENAEMSFVNFVTGGSVVHRFMSMHASQDIVQNDAYH